MGRIEQWFPVRDFKRWFPKSRFSQLKSLPRLKNFQILSTLSPVCETTVRPVRREPKSFPIHLFGGGTQLKIRSAASSLLSFSFCCRRFFSEQTGEFEPEPISFGQQARQMDETTE